MNSTNKLNKIKEGTKIKESINKFKVLNSDYFLQRVFEHIQKKQSLKIVKLNKNIQKRLGFNINTYREYSETFSSIEIEIKPKENAIGSFINVLNGIENYFHIYFNNDRSKEIKRYQLLKDDKVSKINVIIAHHFVLISGLFNMCECIESINFKQFNRTNFDSMNRMFSACTELKEINFSNFKTNNIRDMSQMFDGCSSLKEINLSNFNTNNVTNMSGMFGGCSSLRELNVSNFNTNNVTNM